MGDNHRFSHPSIAARENALCNDGIGKSIGGGSAEIGEGKRGCTIASIRDSEEGKER
jgi:hypothetical protein